jgi:hypothetical protein
MIRTIAEYEPVTLLTPPDMVPSARGRKFGADVEIAPAPLHNHTGYHERKIDAVIQIVR